MIILGKDEGLGKVKLVNPRPQGVGVNGDREHQISLRQDFVEAYNAVDELPVVNLLDEVTVL